MVRGGLDQHSSGDHNGLLFGWLISLRFTPGDARKYAAALVLLGFDDLQSVQEDATPDDLHRAGMKPGHIKRALKALDVQPLQQQQQQPGSSSSSGHRRTQQDHRSIQLHRVRNKFNPGYGANRYNVATANAGSPHARSCNDQACIASGRKSMSNTSSSIDNAAATSAAATGGWIVRSADGGSIVLPPGVSCVVCESDNGQPLRYAVDPSPPIHGREAALTNHSSVEARAAAVAGAGIRRGISSSPFTSRGGGDNAGPLENRASPGAPVPSEAGNGSGQILGPKASTNPTRGRGKHQKPTRVQTRAPGHGASTALPNFGWRSAAGRMGGTARSDGDTSWSPPQDGSDGFTGGGGSDDCRGRSGGGGGGGCCGGGCEAAAVSPARRGYHSMPIVAKRRGVSSARARLLCRGSQGGRNGSGSSGDGRCRAGSGSGSPSDSPGTESGLINEDFSLLGSSTESSGDVSPRLRVWDNDSASTGAATRGDHDSRQQQHRHRSGAMPAIRRRLRVDARARLGGGREAPGCQRHRGQQEGEQPQHMSVLTSPPCTRGATGDRRGGIQRPSRRTFCGEIDSGDAPAAPSTAPNSSPRGRDSRSTASLARRSKFCTAEDKPHSVAACAGGSGSGDGSGAVGGAANRSGPPGRMEIVTSAGGAENENDTRLVDASGARGHRGHLQTIRRMRSTVRTSNASGAFGPLLTRIPGDGDGGGNEEARRTPPPPLLVLPRNAATAAAGASPSAAAEAVREGAETGASGGDAGDMVDVPEDIINLTWKPSGSGGGSRPLMTLDEDSVVTVASSEQRSGGSPEHQTAFASGCSQGDEGAAPHAVAEEASRRSSSSGRSGGGKEDDDDDVSCGILSGLSLDLGNLLEPGFGVEPSYDLSEDGGTLTMHGFVLKPDGIKSTPSTNYAGLDDRGRNSTARACQEARMRFFHPAPLQTQTTSTSAGRTPWSQESTFGGGDSGGGRATGGPQSGGGCALAPLPPPPPLTCTPRRAREKIILLDEIGRGSAGSVHKAIHVPSMRLVAVKTVEVHDDRKRHQILKELKTHIAMEPVTLPSPSVAIGDPASTYSCMGAPGVGGLYGGGGGGGANSSGTGSSCGSWEDEDSPNRAYSQAAVDVRRSTMKCCGEGQHSTSSDGGQQTGTTTTLSSRGGSLSSRDGTPFFPSRQQPRQQRQACHGSVSTLLSTAAAAATPTGRHTRALSGSDGGCGGDGGRRSRSKDSYLPVVTFHDAYMDRERGRVCMVMEYMNGGTLQDFVSEGRQMSEPALADVARSVLRGLEVMHAQRKIHRDIKPSNILLDREGRVKIADFGTVRELNKTGSFGQTFTGTTTYMSPERIQHNAHGCPSDIWSLGMVIATLALGSFPLSTSSTAAIFELMQAISEDPIPALPPARFSPELCNFVEVMLKRNPEERPPAPELLNHPFLVQHQGCDDLVNMVQVPPATPMEVRSLLKKVMDYHLVAAMEERSCNEREPSGSFFGRDTLSWVGCSPRQALTPPPLRKEDVKVLAKQLQVTRTALVKEYESLRKQAELDLCGEHPPQSSRSSWSRRGGANSSFGIAPATPGFLPHSRGGGGGGGRHGRRPPSFMSMSSPQCFDLMTCPTWRGGSGDGGGGAGGACDDTPLTAGSSFSAGAAPRQNRRGAGTPARRSAAQRRSSPSCQEMAQPRWELAGARCHAAANEDKKNG